MPSTGLQFDLQFGQSVFVSYWWLNFETLSVTIGCIQLQQHLNIVEVIHMCQWYCRTTVASAADKAWKFAALELHLALLGRGHMTKEVD